jgi:hypothetical protein
MGMTLGLLRPTCGLDRRGEVMLRISRWVSVFVIVLGVANVSADDPSKGGRLELVESLPRDELDSVVKAVVSPDGKFLYASAWKPSSVLRATMP